MPSQRIALHKYIDDLVWEVDKQTRFNHEECPAGEDTKERLYVKAVLPRNTWVGHCFNCGNSGYVRAKRGFTMTLDELMETAGKTGGTLTTKVQTPVGAAGSRLPLTLEMKVWLYKKHLFEEDFDKLGLQATGPMATWLVIPFSAPNISYVRRAFNEDCTAKYVNHLEPGEVQVFLGTKKPPVVILTEDFISAYRINRDVPEITAIPCMGTNVSDACLKTLLELKPASVLVWFDPDVAGRTKGLDVASRVRVVLSCPVGCVTADKEPKNMSPDELRTSVKGLNERRNSASTTR